MVESRFLPMQAVIADGMPLIGSVAADRVGCVGDSGGAQSVSDVCRASSTCWLARSLTSSSLSAAITQSGELVVVRFAAAISGESAR